MKEKNVQNRRDKYCLYVLVYAMHVARVLLQ